ncbi:MAG: outer membrane protein assembly factor BamC [Gammaproteobacteria bacterium]
MTLISRLALSVLLALALVGCSTVDEKVQEILDKPLEYKQSRDEEPLEIPPDLTKETLRDTMGIPSQSASGSATFSSFNQQGADSPRYSGAQVLPNNPEAKVMRDGSYRWLRIKGNPDAVWDSVRDFWLDNGFLLVIENPDIGIMETEWAEDRADIPLGVVQGFLGSVLENVYDAGSRDKFRVRLEDGEEPGTTDVYLTHQRAEDVVQGDTVKWEYRPRDPEIEVEMLSRLMVHMGVSRDRAARQVASTVKPRQSSIRLIKGDSGQALLMEDGFSRSWRVIGQALDQIGFTVEDRDRSRGIYYVRYRDPELETEEESKSWLSSLKFWGSDEPPPTEQYQILVSAVDRGSRVTVLNEQGQPDLSGTGGRILSLLNEQLR